MINRDIMRKQSLEEIKEMLDNIAYWVRNEVFIEEYSIEHIKELEDKLGEVWLWFYRRTK